MAKAIIGGRAFRSDLTADELRSRLDYNPDTGEFWTKPRKVGSVHLFGAKGDYPVVIISFHRTGITNSKFYAHRLAWLWMTGEWPEAEIDHINGVSTDNRWNNLRAATRQENTRNSGTPKTNTSGFVGAYYDRSINRWRSYIAKKYLGIFDTREEAHEAYRKAAIALYGEFTHHSLTPPVSSRHMAPARTED